MSKEHGRKGSTAAGGTGHTRMTGSTSQQEIQGSGRWCTELTVRGFSENNTLCRRIRLMGWYQLDVDVGMQRLTAPFDFASVVVGNRTEKWRIADTWWNLMIEQADKADVPTGDVDRHPKPNSTRPRGRGRGHGRGRGRGSGRA